MSKYYYAEIQRRYNHSAKGRARRARYKRTAKYRASVQRHNSRAVARAVTKRYRSKPEVREHYNWVNRSWKLARRLRERAL